MSEAIAFLGFDAFVEAERSAPRRHELVGGRVYAMAGGTERHDLAAGLLYERFAPRARERGCRPFTSNRLLRTPADAGYYPDVMIVCGPAPHRHYENAPTLIVEVLSASTAGVDRREKATAYATYPSLQLLLLVDPHERRIEAARPSGGVIGQWSVHGPGEAVPTPFGDLDVDTLYDELDRLATTD